MVEEIKEDVHIAVDMTQLENGYLLTIKKIGSKTRIVKDNHIYCYRTKAEIIKAIEDEL